MRGRIFHRRWYCKMHDHPTGGARNCKLQIGDSAIDILHFAFCILHFPVFCAQQLRFSRFFVGISVMLVLGAAAGGRADVFELAGGGRVEGHLVESPDDDASTLVIALAAGGQLKIARSQITRVESTSVVDAEYEKLSRSIPDSVEAHLKMAEWCSERKLRGRAEQHYARILEFAPNHEAASA